jgi:hypothetical protein
LVIRFIVLLELVTTSNYSAVANSHTLQFNTACTVFSVCCVLTSCLVIASSTVAPSAFVFHGSSPCLAAACHTTNCGLLRNNLQQWGLPCLPCLRQRQLSHNSLRLGLVCLPVHSLETGSLVLLSLQYSLRMDPTENIFSCSCDIAQSHSHQGRPHRKCRFRQLFCCCVHNCC